jgi:glycosyltransferase involved in cell wall biosynthesis
MKIALLSFEYPSETGLGGIGTYTWYHARALAKLGHEVHVLAGALATTPFRRDDHDGVVVHRFKTDGRLMRSFGLLEHWQLWWSKNRLENGLSMYRGLTALLERHGYDLVEMPECGGEGWLLNRLVRVPTLVRFHSPARLIMEHYDVRRADVWLCSSVEGMAIRRARAFSSCSQFLATEVRRALGVTAPVRVIPNGIDLDLFDAADQVDIRKTFDLPPTRPLILFAGRMERRKGIHLCPEIVSRILTRHDVAFVFAGRDLFGRRAR